VRSERVGVRQRVMCLALTSNVPMTYVGLVQRLRVQLQRSFKAAGGRSCTVRLRTFDRCCPCVVRDGYGRKLSREHPNIRYMEHKLYIQ
jgi:hypothetical protein